MAGAAMEITDANFEAEVAQSKIPVLVDFWAEWCGPCRMVGPVIEELAKEYAGKVKVGKCNVDNSQDIPARHGIASIPSILMFKNGELVDKIVGAESKAKFKAMIDRALA
ncbi:MAG: thioredoxin [Planctomycetota bacterium]